MAYQRDLLPICSPVLHFRIDVEHRLALLLANVLVDNVVVVGGG